MADPASAPPDHIPVFIAAAVSVVTAIFGGVTGWIARRTSVDTAIKAAEPAKEDALTTRYDRLLDQLQEERDRASAERQKAEDRARNLEKSIEDFRQSFMAQVAELKSQMAAALSHLSLLEGLLRESGHAVPERPREIRRGARASGEGRP